jgi:hypothetical protein
MLGTGTGTGQFLWKHSNFYAEDTVTNLVYGNEKVNYKK